jgi:hypothetical protein
MEPFNVTNHDHNEGPYLRLKKKRKEHPHPQKEVEEIEAVIAEHASQCTATSFCLYRTYQLLTLSYAKFNSQHESYIGKYV